MTAAAQDRNTEYQEGEFLPPIGVAASTKIYAGTMVANNGSGYAIPAADAASLVVLGRAEEQVDNSAGSAGDLSISIRRKKAFWLANDGTNPVTIAHIGGNVYVKDDQTVSSSGGVNSIVAGKALAVDAAKGVLVYIG